eukprot:CAMPEP_0201514386 /NCGR_PEP_ID=MMETSP0161_2-20130828/6242_1 /ASSEMBLY_ACC=CAM_ASM_000251 /TAXON_ID=180227 /ORGANISM="Neoparamoeba aestuarina, Strain SoJaBio B1-5/56/2" /LENGTH=148 /DNA_ID=CAMNT_0047910919 /DNA_START=201 /DNA_END=644 /DNA_ORIENTATION=+
MDMVCSTLNEGILSLDGVSFYNSPSDCCDHSVSAHLRRRAVYQGPTFHNGMLASIMLGIPIPDTVHPHRQHARNWYNPYQGTTTKYTKYDHMPVHTINPELYEAFLLYANELGITDDLAAFIATYSEYVMNEETQLWCDDINATLDMV